MLFQLLHDAPAETTGYMVAGYIVIFGLMSAYLISLALRRHSLEQDLEVLEDLEKKD